MVTCPEEMFGEEKNGTSLQTDHRTSPVSCNGDTTHQPHVVSSVLIQATLLTHWVETEQATSQRRRIQLPEGGLQAGGGEHGPPATVTLPHTLLQLQNTSDTPSLESDHPHGRAGVIKNNTATKCGQD